MEKTQIIQGVVDALTGKQIYEFTIKVKHVGLVASGKRSFWKKLLEGKKVADPVTERTFQIWPCVAINQYRIAGKALSLPTELYEDATQMFAYIPDHLPTMIYIIAAAVQNDYREPEAELITFFERNLDSVDIAEILNASLQAANIQSFLTSIVLMNGMAKVLEPEASPQDGRE